LSLETCRGRKINTLKEVKKCVKLVVNPELPQDARSTKYEIGRLVTYRKKSYFEVESNKQGVTNTEKGQNERNIPSTVQKVNPINSTKFRTLFRYL
jgi:hypothetical protein